MSSDKKEPFRGGVQEFANAWSPEETTALVQAVGRLGTKWITVKAETQALSHLSTAALRNKWFRLNDQQQMDKRKNRCTICKRFKRGHVCSPIRVPLTIESGESGEFVEAPGGADCAVESETDGIDKQIIYDLFNPTTPAFRNACVVLNSLKIQQEVVPLSPIV